MILVTGAEGMVGSYVKTVFESEPLYLTDKKTMDITHYDSILQTVEGVKPAVILHLAAATDVDRCEVEPDWAYRTNVIGTQNIVSVCQQKNILLVLVSTSSVFNGNKPEPYTEFDTPDPLSVYAKTKWEAEKIVQTHLSRFFIVRASWMIGGKEKDKKFVAKMIERCQTADVIEGVDDRFGTITYAEDLLKTIRMLFKTPFYGTYHVANHGVCSRFEIAREIAKILKSPVKVLPVSSDRFPLAAPRGRSEAIANYKLALMGIDPLPSWQTALSSYLQSWFNA